MVEWIYQLAYGLATNLSALSLSAVLIMIAIRQVKSCRLAIWQIMMLGALFVLFTGQITPKDAMQAINPDVMVFLAGMFVIGEAMQKSGYLLILFGHLFSMAKNLDQLIIIVIFTMGFLAALLMNDTLAIIGTPLMIYLARTVKISAKLFLLTLAFAVTIGSAMSPIGNPQNLLIAVNAGLSNPFLTFLQYLLLPTVVNLLLAYLLLRVFYREYFQRVYEHVNNDEYKTINIHNTININNNINTHNNITAHDGRIIPERQNVADPDLASLSRTSFLLLFALIIAKIAFVLLGAGEQFHLTYIATVSALPILLFSRRRVEIARDIDWCTLVFFASMFVLMESVWKSGLIQQAISCGQTDFSSIPAILAFSVLLSQIISNVPFVALCQPLLVNPSASALMALAAGSTIAGNLFILGAASNVIIIQNAEKCGETITFLEFAKIGIPLTAVNLLIYWLFL